MESALVRINSSEYPEFSDDILYDGLEHGILQSIVYLNKVRPTESSGLAKTFLMPPT